jgi:hypothetical protein
MIASELHNVKRALDSLQQGSCNELTVGEVSKGCTPVDWIEVSGNAMQP